MSIGLAARNHCRMYMLPEAWLPAKSVKREIVAILSRGMSEADSVNQITATGPSPQGAPENKEAVIAIQGGGIYALPMLGQARAIIAAGYIPLAFAGNSGG